MQNEHSAAVAAVVELASGAEVSVAVSEPTVVPFERSVTVGKGTAVPLPADSKPVAVESVTVGTPAVLVSLTDAGAVDKAVSDAVSDGEDSADGDEAATLGSVVLLWARARTPSVKMRGRRRMVGSGL